MEQEQAKTHRRYREGRERYYDFQFAAEVRNSSVLNGEFQSGEIDDLIANKEKRLQLLQREWEGILAEQERAKQASYNKGGEYSEDDRTREKRMSLEARADVSKWEISELREAIEDEQREKERSEIPPCLPCGPEGVNSVPGSIGKGYVDGQFCRHLKNVGLVIVDKRSIFRGMSVVDYINHIAKPWLRASSEFKSVGIKPGEYSHWRGSRFVPWPEWPANVKYHLLDGKASVQANLQRTSESKLVRRKR